MATISLGPIGSRFPSRTPAVNCGGHLLPLVDPSLFFFHRNIILAVLYTFEHVQPRHEARFLFRNLSLAAPIFHSVGNLVFESASSWVSLSIRKYYRLLLKTHSLCHRCHRFTRSYYGHCGFSSCIGQSMCAIIFAWRASLRQWAHTVPKSVHF